MGEINVEELRINPQSLSILFDGEEKKSLEEIKQLLGEVLNNEELINDDEIKFKIYQMVIKCSNKRIEEIEYKIDEKRIEIEAKQQEIDELKRFLEEEQKWKNEVKQAKDAILSKIEEKNKSQKNDNVEPEPEEYDEEEYDEDGFNKKGYNSEGFDRNGFNAEGIHKETGTKFGPDNFNKYGYDAEEYDKEGYSRSGFDRDGFDRNGYNAFGYTREGFDENGNYLAVFDFSDLKEKRVEVIKGMSRKEKLEILNNLRNEKELLDTLLVEEIESEKNKEKDQ